MSASKRMAFAVIVSWLSKLLNIVANLFFMPVLFRFLGQEELGLWFLLGNSQSFLSLLGLGIAPVLARHIALAKGESGSSLEAILSSDGTRRISDLVTTGKIILRGLSVFVFLVAWISGYALLRQIDLKDLSFATVFLSWTLLCFGYAISVWVRYLNCWLEGLGYVGLDSLIITIVSVATIITNILIVTNGGGLLALSIVTVISGLSQRLLLVMFVKRRKIDFSFTDGEWNSEYAKRMIQPAFHSWLTSLGMFLILKTDQYFITINAGVESIPAYNAAYQLASNLRNVSIPFALSASTFISQLWQAGDLKGVHRLVRRSCNYGLLIMCTGSGYLIAIGKDLTDLWLGPNVFVGSAILITFCIMFIFEVQNVCLMYAAKATEYEKFAVSSLSAGILNLLFTAVLIKPLGLWGVSLGTLIGQSLTSNWYIAFISLKRLKITFSDYFIHTVFPAIATLVMSIAVSLIVSNVANFYTENSVFVLMITASFCCFPLLISLWCWTFEDSQKQRVISNIQIALA